MALTNNQKLMLYLSDYYRLSEPLEPRTAQSELTQDGIALGTGLGRANVALHLKKLSAKGFVNTMLLHTGGRKRRKTYFLTAEGMRCVERLNAAIAERKICFTDLEGKVEITSGATVLTYLIRTVGLKRFEAFEHLLATDTIDARKLISSLARSIPSDTIPKGRFFFGRKKELQLLVNWLTAGKKLIVIAGLPGIGKTMLAAELYRMLIKRSQSLVGCDIGWFKIRDWQSSTSILKGLANWLATKYRVSTKMYLDKTGANIDWNEARLSLINDLEGIKRTIVIFDDYSSQVQQFFRFLLDIVGELEHRVTLILTSRIVPEFYSRTDVINGSVAELKLEGLDRDAGRELISAFTGTVTSIAHDRLYDVTRGHPLAIELFCARYGPMINLAPAMLGEPIRWGEELTQYLHTEICARLTPEEKALIERISVYRLPVRIEFLGSVEPVIVAGLILKSLLTRVGDTYQSHDMIRAFFYSNLSVTRKKLLHAEAAANYLQLFESEQRKECKLRHLVERLYHLFCSEQHKKYAEILAHDGMYLINHGFAGEIANIIEKISLSKIPGDLQDDIIMLKSELYDRAGDWQRALAEYNTLSPSPILSLHKARVLSKLRRWKQAEAETRTIIEARGHVNNVLRAEAYLILGSINWERGELEKAQEAYEKCASFASTPSMKAKALFGIGNIFMRQEKFKSALQYMLQSKKILDDWNDIRALATLYNNIGVCYNGLGKWQDAIANFEQSMALSRSIGDNYLYGYALRNAAENYVRIGKFERARESMEHAMTIFQKLGNLLEIGLSYASMGNIYRFNSAWTEANQWFEKSVAVLKEAGSKRELAETYDEWAELYVAMGDKHRASKLLTLKKALL